VIKARPLTTLIEGDEGEYDDDNDGGALTRPDNAFSLQKEDL
jgi:hypothetical protein